MRFNIATLIAVAGLMLSIITAVVDMNRSGSAEAVRIADRLTADEDAIRSLKAESDANRAKLSGRFKFMMEAKQALDHLCEAAPKCRSRFGPVTLPE